VSKFLTGEGFYLKKLSNDDNLENYLEMVNDVKELKYVDELGRYPLNIDELKGYISSVSGLFLSIFNSENEHVGNIRVTEPHPINRHCHLGILIHKKYRGNGLGNRVSSIVIRHLFNSLNINRVELYVAENNLSAIKLYEGLGFIQEGVKREAMWVDGKYENLLVYSILATEFFKKEKSK
jgi:ribosomal-protein-alanine N-acetyltransferase